MTVLTSIQGTTLRNGLLTSCGVFYLLRSTSGRKQKVTFLRTHTIHKPVLWGTVTVFTRYSTASYVARCFIPSAKHALISLTQVLISGCCTWYYIYKGRTQGDCRVPAPQNPPKPKLKKKGFIDIVISNSYVIYPSAEISHLNQLMTETLQF